MVISYENKNLSIKLNTMIYNENIYIECSDICNYFNISIEYIYEIIYNTIGDLKCIISFSTKTTTMTKQLKSYFIKINELCIFITILNHKESQVIIKWLNNTIKKTIEENKIKHSNALTNRIENEDDLHINVVKYIKLYYPNVLIHPGLGENQDTKYKRQNSKLKGYTKGQPDLLLLHAHNEYYGLVIEFKSPKNTGKLSNEQINLLQKYERSGYYVIVSNDYNKITDLIKKYFNKNKCKYCKNYLKQKKN